MKKYLVFAVLLAFMASCSDEEAPVTKEEETKEPTKTELATEAQWRLDNGTIIPSVEVEILGNKITVENYWDLLAAVNQGVVPDCDKDNEMILASDSSVTLSEGPTKCDVNDPDSEDGGSWFFVEEETKMTFTSFPFDPTSEPRTLEILELTENSLKLKMDYVFLNPIDNSTSDHVINLEYTNTAE